MRRPLAFTGTALLAVSFLFLGAASATANEGITGGGSITIPGTGTAGPGNPFPSSGTMSGVPGTITSVQLTLTGLFHTFPDDLQVVLQSPAGQSVMLLGMCGGGPDAMNATITFADGAPAVGMPLASGTVSPTVCNPVALDSYPLPAPAPALPYEATLASMNGFEPNGQWNLWIFDSLGGDSGTLASWTVSVTTEVPAIVVTPPAPELAATGVDGAAMTLGAMTLLTVGGALLYARRRFASEA